MMSTTAAPEMLVRDLMTSDVFTVDRNDALLNADRIMNLGRVRHLLVTDEDGKLAGVLSQRDLFHSGLLKALGYGTHARQKTLDELLIKEVMTTELVTVTPTTPIKEAASTMFKQKIGCLPVLEGSTLVGILTEGDFVRLHAD
jgi:CBS domain-containing protein